MLLSRVEILLFIAPKSVKTNNIRKKIGTFEDFNLLKVNDFHESGVVLIELISYNDDPIFIEDVVIKENLAGIDREV